MIPQDRVYYVVYSTFLNFLDIFIISEVIPLFVLRKMAIFGIELCQFLATWKLEQSLSI